MFHNAYGQLYKLISCKYFVNCLDIKKEIVKTLGLYIYIEGFIVALRQATNAGKIIYVHSLS